MELRDALSTKGSAPWPFGHRKGAGDARRRQRSRVPDGQHVRRHGEASARARRAPVSIRSRMPCSGEHDRGHGHGGEATGGGELSGATPS